MPIIAQYEGILSEVDAEGNVVELYPLIKTDENLKDSGKAADAAEVGIILAEVNRKLDNLAKASTIYKGNLVAGNTSITIENESITKNSILTFFTSIYGVNPSSVTASTGSVTLTFDAQDVDMEVGVRVDG